MTPPGPADIPAGDVIPTSEWQLAKCSRDPGTGVLTSTPTTTEAERLATGDPRLSLEERYGNHGGYVNAARHAAQALRDEGFLLREDFNRIVQETAQIDVLRQVKDDDDDDRDDDDEDRQWRGGDDD